MHQHYQLLPRVQDVEIAYPLMNKLTLTVAKHSKEINSSPHLSSRNPVQNMYKKLFKQKLLFNSRTIKISNNDEREL